MAGKNIRFKKVANLDKVIRGRVTKALKTAMEDTLLKQKEVVPVAFAEGATEYGWPVSFQEAASTPEGATPGGTLKRGLTAEIDDSGKAPAAVFKSQVPYGVWVHEGTTRMEGRPYLTEPIRRVGVPSLMDALQKELGKPFKLE